MKYDYNDHKINDLLNIKISNEQKRVIDTISEEKLYDIVAKFEYFNESEYGKILDLITEREVYKLILIGKDGYYDYEEYKGNELLETVLKKEFLFEPNFSNEIDFFENIDLLSLFDYIESNEICKKAVKQINEDKVRDGVLSSEDVLYFYKTYISFCIEFIQINNAIKKKIVDSYKEWKLSPDLINRFYRLYEDCIPGLRKQGRFTTSDPLEFLKFYYKQNRFKNLNFNDQIDEFRFEDFIRYDHFQRDISEKLDTELQSKIEKDKLLNCYIIDLPIIDRLFLKYGKFMMESKESWRERFIDLDTQLKIPSTMEIKCKKESNLHLLITILSVIDDKLLEQKTDGKVINDFEKYVLTRWGIRGFRDLKSRNYRNHDRIHSQLMEINRMI